ncbi:MAG: hypothetical protein ACREHE_07115 [Rhizomicrobium sp.]
MSEHFTVPEKLLLAALEVRKRSATFTAENLVVEAWKQYPDTFGLSGYASEHPDSNRVLTNIMGTKGMRGKGWLKKVGEKRYQLTSAGLTDGEVLLQRNSSSSTTSDTRFLRAELDRHAATALSRILSTPVVKKALAKQDDAISFNDACAFWDITVRSNANTLTARLADVTVLIDRALEASNHAGGSGGLKIGGVTLTRYQFETLAGLNRILQEKFKAELDIIRKRTDERLERKARPS